MQIIHYTSCPVCGSPETKEVLSARDYTVSLKHFTICECADCGVRFTQDVPDANAIGEFYKSENYISHTDTTKGFINKLYRLVRKRTLRQKRKLVESIAGNNGKLLDVGSGTGAFVQEMKNAGWEITGLEPDETARKIAGANFGIELSDASQLYNLPAGSFDAITLWHVMEHVHALHPYLEQMKKLLKGSGSLFVAVPNYESTDARVYGAYWAAYDVPRHLYHFSPGSMKRLVEIHGMKINAMKPMWFDSFYISLLSNKNKSGSAAPVTAFVNGLRSNLAAAGNLEKCSSLIYIISK